MLTDSLAYVRDLLHAQFCYQVFITPLHLPVEKEYRDFAKLACEMLEGKRSEVIHKDEPRHHVLHHFIPQNNFNGKKVLILHGWISRAAYMVRFINILHQQGYEVYALDFPAHGEAKGLQLPWIDAVSVLKEIINEYGPFYSVIGHSFGGSMILNAINLSGQLPEWHLLHQPERVIMIASPTQMRNPITQVAKKLKLNGHGYLHLRHLIQNQSKLNLSLIRLGHLVSDIKFLCIHGKNDETVSPEESIRFCNKYTNADLHLLPDATHVSVLMDKRVEYLITQFLED